MTFRRTAALVTGILVLASTLSVVGTASASPSPRTATPQQPSVAVRSLSGQPSRNYAIPSGVHFAFPNKGKRAKVAIRNRVLFTVQSVWGGVRDRNRLPMPGNGTIRIATWSFKDMTMAKALYAAHRRGVSVQVVAAQGANKKNRPWKWLKRKLGQRYYKPGVVGSSEKVSFARDCRGSCRGRGGTPHSKFFLFDNVGSAHQRHISVQSSMNLTRFGYTGQWNHAQVIRSTPVYEDFMRVYREMRINRPNPAPYRKYVSSNVTTLFFPLPGATASSDPVMQALNQTRCTGATSGGTSAGRTRIRIIQYAIYDTRGLWLSKKLRALWQAGCDVRIIYSLATRPVLSILRSTSGRGAIPMKQSVIRNRRGEIVKYNHSKYMTITGNWGGSTGSWISHSGSANWSNAAFYADEQMQQINGYGTARQFLVNFDQTWRQRTSRAPSFRGSSREARLASNQIAFGKGEYKHLTPYGD